MNINEWFIFLKDNPIFIALFAIGLCCFLFIGITL